MIESGSSRMHSWEHSLLSVWTGIAPVPVPICPVIRVVSMGRRNTQVELGLH
jgi:hypothetical protein